MKLGKFKPRGNQSGFTLIESMVAILVMAMGLIGIALMQAQGLKFSDGAYSRTQASMMANDILDRMRIHAKSSLDTDTNISDDSYIDEFIAASEAIEADSGMCVHGQNIDPGELVFVEVACWKDAIDAQLGGTAVIEKNDATSVAVVVNWRDRTGVKDDRTVQSEERELRIVGEFGNLN